MTFGGNQMLAKRQETIAKHKIMDQLHGKQPNGDMPLGDRPVLFLREDDAVFVADCATRCWDELKAFYEQASPEVKRDSDAQLIRAVRVAEITTGLSESRMMEMRTYTDGTTPMLSIRRDVLNDVLWALHERGILVCSTGMPKKEKSSGQMVKP
jgi:hypothetical protein